MKKFILLTGSLTLALGASIAISAGAPVGNIFQGGQPAIAADVNANFQELADRIDNIPTTASFNYSDFIPTTDQTKVFDKSNNDGSTVSDCGTKSLYIYSGTATSTLTRTIKSADSSGVACSNPSYAVFTFIKNANSLDYTQKQDITAATGAVFETESYDQPLTPLINNMQLGHTWGTASIHTVTTTGAPTTTESFIQQRNLAAVESVTVPIGGGTTYDNCLKIIKTDLIGGSTPSTNIAARWYCPSIGLVKIINSKQTFVLADVL